jgi:hypothetical protein
MLVNTDVNNENLFGSWEHIAVKGSIDAGQSFTFVDYNNPFTVPNMNGDNEQTFFSTWRLWMHTRYIGPQIRISFSAKK